MNDKSMDEMIKKFVEYNNKQKELHARAFMQGMMNYINNNDKKP